MSCNFRYHLLVPKLQLGNSVLEALASCLAKPELRPLGSQAGAWEPVHVALLLYNFLRLINQLFEIAFFDDTYFHTIIEMAGETKGLQHLPDVDK